MKLAEAFAKVLEEFKIGEKILSVTCNNNNASPNNTVIKKLSKLLKSFPGNANHTCRFLHILNLVAKSMIQQFDLPKDKADEALTEVERELMSLADGLNDDGGKGGGDSDDKNKDTVDDMDSWIDKQLKMSEKERMELDAGVQPVRMVLVKVS